MLKSNTVNNFRFMTDVFNRAQVLCSIKKKYISDYVLWLVKYIDISHIRHILVSMMGLFVQNIEHFYLLFNSFSENLFTYNYA